MNINAIGVSYPEVLKDISTNRGRGQGARVECAAKDHHRHVHEWRRHLGMHLLRKGILAMILGPVCTAKVLGYLGLEQISKRGRNEAAEILDYGLCGDNSA